jgi:hypothetical protein
MKAKQLTGHKTNNAPDTHNELVQKTKERTKGRQKDRFAVDVFEERKDPFNENKTLTKLIYQIQSPTKEQLKRSIKKRSSHNERILHFSEIKPITYAKD